MPALFTNPLIAVTVAVVIILFFQYQRSHDLLEVAKILIRWRTLAALGALFMATLILTVILGILA